jgi:hypothetical protein
MDKVYLIRHAVGSRLFLSTENGACECTAEKTNEGWSFRWSGVGAEQMEAIWPYRHEWNVFEFHQEAGQSIYKIWYYVLGDTVRYEKDSGTLSFNASHRIEYTPE